MKLKQILHLKRFQLVLLLMCSPILCLGQNVVLNPNFSDTTNEDLRDPNGPWKLNKIEWEKTGDGTAKAVENMGLDSSAAFLFQKDNSANQVNDINLRQDVAITEGNIYQFSFLAKLEQVPDNYLRFSVVKIKNGQPINVTYWEQDTLEVADYVNWNSYSGEFQIPAGTNTDTIRMIFYRVPGGDSCWIDNVSMNIRERATYYISSSNGNDSNDGLSPSTAWASLNKVSTHPFIPGDSILFKSQDEFIGQLAVSSSGTPQNPIVFSSYDNGDQPIINGSGAPGGDYEFAVFIENQQGIVLDNLEITNDRQVTRPDNKDTRCYGVLIRVNQPESMEYFRLQNLTIKNIYPVHLDGVDFYNVEVAGIHVYTTANYKDKEKNISDVWIENCDISTSAKFGVWSVHGFAIEEGIGNDSINRNKNIVIRNNYIHDNGGSGVTISKAYNSLIENNLIENSGASANDPRMVGRGSSIWFFNSHYGISQYNTLLHVRGEIDSYSQHIDYSNRHIIMQYNYSEDNEGGFCQILGDNKYSTYRYNISVNDGFRNSDHVGSTLRLTDYAGSKKIRSDSTYIYGNTLFINDTFSTNIYLDGLTTFVGNNIFCSEGEGEMGGYTYVVERGLEYITVTNNCFYGKASNRLKELDNNHTIKSPYFVGPDRQEPANFKLSIQTNLAYQGTPFSEPEFPKAGLGIFKDIKAVPDLDYFGNTINVAFDPPHIGAHAGGDDFDNPSANPVNQIVLKGNPVTDLILADLPSIFYDQTLDIQIIGVNGQVVQEEHVYLPSETSLVVKPNKGLQNGMYVMRIILGNEYSVPFILMR